MVHSTKTSKAFCSIILRAFLVPFSFSWSLVSQNNILGVGLVYIYTALKQTDRQNGLSNSSNNTRNEKLWYKLQYQMNELNLINLIEETDTLFANIFTERGFAQAAVLLRQVVCPSVRNVEVSFVIKFISSRQHSSYSIWGEWFRPIT